MPPTHQPRQAVFQSILPEDIAWKPFALFHSPMLLASLGGDVETIKRVIDAQNNRMEAKTIESSTGPFISHPGRGCSADRISGETNM